MATPDSYVVNDIQNEKYYDQYYTPWSERVKEGDDPKIYHERMMESIPIIFGYLIIYGAMLGFMFDRYTQSNVFWLIFTIILVWGMFATLSIWYIVLHSGFMAGIATALLFILLQILLMNLTIESEYQERIQLVRVRYTPNN